MQQPEVQIMDILTRKPLQSIAINEFVAVVYDDQWWLGTVQEVSVENNDANVSFLHPAGPRTSFHWASTPDVCWIKYTNILGVLNPDNMPSLHGSRNLCITTETKDAIHSKFLSHFE